MRRATRHQWPFLPCPSEQEQSETIARIALFASPKIARQLGGYEETRRAALGELVATDMMTEAGREAALAKLEPALEALEEKMEKLRTEMHAEIAGAKPLARS